MESSAHRVGNIFDNVPHTFPYRTCEACALVRVEAVEMTKRETAEGRIESATRLGFVSYARVLRETGR